MIKTFFPKLRVAGPIPVFRSFPEIGHHGGFRGFFNLSLSSILWPKSCENGTLYGTPR
jgi:hypothetical protein